MLIIKIDRRSYNKPKSSAIGWVGGRTVPPGVAAAGEAAATGGSTAANAGFEAAIDERKLVAAVIGSDIVTD